MKISIISFTALGDETNKRCGKLFQNMLFKQNGKTFKQKRCSLKEWTKDCFENSDALIFIGAVGIAVRAIAPFIKSKDTDPAVVVTDECGRFTVPILSGHIGGANGLAEYISKNINSVPVITTATDINGVWAVDAWATDNGYSIGNISNIKYISAALLGNECVGLQSDFEVCGKMPKNVVQDLNCTCGISISDSIKTPFMHTLNLFPKRLVIGVGSRKNADEDALIKMFQTLRLNKKTVAYVATIDIKKNEKAVLKLSEYLKTELKTYTAEELNQVRGDFESSDFVKRITGTDNVCERAALATGGELILKKTKGDGVTMAVAKIDWSVHFGNINGGG